MLTEILNTRSLRALGLVRLAPTVLVSAKPQADMGEVFPMPALGDPATMARKLLGHR